MLKALTKLQTRIATRDKGATAVEYGLLVALIAAVIALAIGFALGWRMLDRRIRAKYGGPRIY